MSSSKNKMGALALALMVFTSVYGFANIPLAFYKMSYSSIPYFIIGALLCPFFTYDSWNGSII